MYEEKIHELELTAGAYRYLEELGKKYAAKYKSFGDYMFHVDPCEYNIIIPELNITFSRLTDFRLKSIIKYTEKKFHYEICHFNHEEDRVYTCSNEADMLEKFDKFLSADCQYVMQQDRKKTLIAIDSLNG